MGLPYQDVLNLVVSQGITQKGASIAEEHRNVFLCRKCH